MATGTLSQKPLPKQPIRRGHILLHLGLITGSLVMLLPFIWMLSTSFKVEKEVFTFPPSFIPQEDVLVSVPGEDRLQPLFTVALEDGTTREMARLQRRGNDVTLVDPDNGEDTITVDIGQIEPVRRVNFELNNYVDAWTALPFDRFYFNSFVVAVSETFLQLLISSLAAFAFARLQFKGRNVLFTLYLATLMIPFPVLLIPNFIMVSKYLNLYDTYPALILPPAFSAFSTFLLRQHYMNLPLDLDESARIDGASSFRIWWSIVVPMSKTTLAALAIFIFLGSWNSFLWPLVITNSIEMRTVPIGLNSFQGQFNTKWNLLMAAAVVAMAPVVTIYVFAQKWFIRGIALTGISGR
jgi:ABC-type glycerol-3-phosphate transport system permease component